MLLLCLLVSQSNAWSQVGLPFAVWEDPNTGLYNLANINGSTGTMSIVNVLIGVDAFVAGSNTTIDTDEMQYHFMGLDNGQVKYYTVDINTGNILNSPIINDNLIGIEYNCNDSILYAMREVNNNYDLVKLDPVNGIVTSIATMPGIDGYVGNTFALDRINQQFIFVALQNGLFYLQSYDLKSGNQLHSNLMPDNLTGYRYSCSDSALYALWEKNGGYLLEKVDVQTGIHNTVVILNGVAPGIIPESSCVNGQGIYAYRGFDSSNSIAVISIELTTGIVNAIAHTIDNAVGFEEGLCCYDTSSTTVSMYEFPESNLLAIAPNPTLDDIQVTLPDLEGILVKVYSNTGQLIYSEIPTIGSVVHEVKTDSWDRGVYFMELFTTTGKKYSAKIIKN